MQHPPLDLVRFWRSDSVWCLISPTMTCWGENGNRFTLTGQYEGKTIREELDAKWHRSLIASFALAKDGLLRKPKRISEQINSIEDDFVAISDSDLHDLTGEFRQRYADGGNARRSPARGLRRRARGRQAHPRPAGISTSS